MGSRPSLLSPMIELPALRARSMWTRTFSRSAPLESSGCYGYSGSYRMSSSFPASFVRGGTSNGLMIKRSDLPSDVADWQPILASAMGSPDSFGRQLNGMGSGVSSTSKIVIVEKSTCPDIDVDYTFVQVGIKDGSIDLAGNCGNLSSAVGPFALDEGLLGKNQEPLPGSKITARLFNINTSKRILSTFKVSPEDRQFDHWGEYSIDGVPGTGSKITLSFLDPEGAKTAYALPTGKPIDVLKISTEKAVRATLTDIANPGVFVLASDLNISSSIHPDELGSNTLLMQELELIRQAGTSAMGLDPEVQSIPKIVILSQPSEKQASEGVNIVCRGLSMQQAHKAVPLTLALNLGASCRIPGTLAHQTAVGVKDGGSVTIAHASGKVQVGSVFKDGKVESALLHRTARVLMKGQVFY